MFKVIGLCFGAVFALTAAGQVAAAEWEKSADISLGEVFTDNVSLDEEGEDSDFITVLTPSFTLKGEGRRANLDAAVSFQFNDLDGEADNFNPKGRINADIELLENFFFVESDARAGQTVINPFSAAGSALNSTGNVTTTYDYSVTPYIVHRFKQFAEFRMEYSYDEQTSNGNDLADSTKDSAEVSLSSGSDFAKLSWRLLGEYDDTSYDDDPGLMNRKADNERTSGSLRLNYQLARQWQISGSVGKEWNTYESTRTVDTDDQFWDTGIRWTPTERTTLEAGYGERFFGSTPRFKAEHRTRRTTLSIDYVRSLTDTRSERNNFFPFPTEDAFGNEIDPQLADALRELLDINTFDEQGIFVNERLEGSLAVRGKRTTLNLSARRSRQIRQDINSDALFLSYRVSVERELSSTLSFDSRLSWQSQEETTGQAFDTFGFSFGFSKELGENTDLELRYSYSDRDSDGAGSDYQENRISLQFSLAL